MKKLFLIMLTIALALSLCSCLERTHDYIKIYSKTDWVFDDVEIEIKDGYFYNRHEKFKVDENTVAVTLYFTQKDFDEWEEKGGAE